MNRKTLNFMAAGSLLAVCSIHVSCSKEHVNQSTDQLLNVSKIKAVGITASVQSLSDYELIWSDEFNTVGGFDDSKWSYAERGTVAWNKYMTHTSDYVSQDGNNLVLRMDNAVIPTDPVPYHSGGVKSQSKFSMTFGKVEVRAKFTQGRGSWPAIWMMPEPATAYAGWPGCGEIDIMEHVNNEMVVHQSVHNATVTGSGGGTSATHSTSYNAADYNIYGLEWSPNALKFFVNNTLQYTYTKAAGATWQQWPFDVPFYLILNQAGGAGWPGAITNADLPFNMQVDYVRVYNLPIFYNGGFETGTLSPWTSWGGNAAIVNSNMRTGLKCIQLTGGANAVEQYLTGLQPNTTYRFSGYGKVAAAGQQVLLGVKGYGGAAVDAAFNTTAYSNNSVTFTTGATQTTATLYFYKAGTGTVYGDDFTLEKL